jgi:phosphoenolpyruvate carboxykinase (GTP)
MPGYEITTIGDDIAWLRFGDDGRLYAVNPEHGFFGVAPGTSARTNPNALAMVHADTIFTNVAMTPDRRPWWEGLSPPPPELVDWRGHRWTPDAEETAAHPNSRFTAPAARCPTISPRFDDPAGVPISAIIFGGRRATLAPLVYQTFDWTHGVFAGAAMASETTAAATGRVGVVRRDPMAMRPFIGYHVGDYLNHWLQMGARGAMPPVFHVNWFRRDEDGRMLWTGFGENLRVLRWILDRVGGRGEAVESPIGYLPTPEAIDTTGLDLSRSTLQRLLEVDADEWAAEADEIGALFDSIGDKLPDELRRERQRLMARLGR